MALELAESKKRNTAFKLRIGDVLKGKPIISEGRLLFVEIGDKKVVRVNIIANVIEKYVSDGEKKYASLTIDDASGQIKLKSFGEDIAILKELVQGDTLQIIGVLRDYNNELYVLPEITKRVDPRWLLVRKLEIQKLKEGLPLPANASLRDILLEKIKESEKEDGIDIDKLIMEVDSSPSVISAETKKLAEEGLIYEPRPGRVRYLG
jgi:DNA-binding transcriptional ArsR family regulator